ncbi:MAG: hypothetical protein FWH01_00910 [Oscillospiraceae bacterium]|nr:hypothetical protein [Oscillospiraceae bacterium]
MFNRAIFIILALILALSVAAGCTAPGGAPPAQTTAAAGAAATTAAQVEQTTAAVATTTADAAATTTAVSDAAAASTVDTLKGGTVIQSTGPYNGYVLANKDDIMLTSLSAYNQVWHDMPEGLTRENNPFVNWSQDNAPYRTESDMLPMDGALDKVTMILASGEHPDYFGFSMTKAQYSSLAKTGAFMDIEPLLEFMPSVKNWIPESVWTAMRIDGKIYAIPNLTPRLFTNAIAARIDVMDELNLESPRTLDEFYEFFKQIGDPDNNVYALGQIGKGITGDGFRGAGLFDGFTGAFGIGASTILRDDGKLYYSYIEPEALEYLNYMHMLYAEKLLYPEFPTTDPLKLREVIAAGNVMVATLPFFNMKWQTDQLEANFPNAVWDWIEYPVGENGEVGVQVEPIYNSLHFIPSRSRYPVEAALIHEWSMSDEVQDVRSAGFEGEHYDRVNGEIVIREDNPKPTWGSAGTLDWKSFKLRQTIAGVYDFHERRKEYGTIMDYYLYSPYIADVEDVWNELHDYVNEQYIKFIIGTRPLTDFDKFVGEVKALGADQAFAALNEWYVEAY